MVYFLSIGFFVIAACLVVFVFVELNTLEQGLRDLSKDLAKHFGADPREFLS